MTVSIFKSEFSTESCYLWLVWILPALAFECLLETSLVWMAWLLPRDS